MRYRILYFFMSALVLMGTTSCATLFTKSRKNVMFKGIPHTDLYDSKGKIGEIGNNGFVTIPLRKKLGSKEVTASLDGYESRTVGVRGKVVPATFFNIFSFALPGLLIDAASGKMFTYKGDVVDVTLEPKTNSNSTRENTSTVQTQRVTRDNAGNSDPERAIVRWNIESDPAGARVFWRVISSVPDEVKNTNETYLTTTPYEETRSFNILGLTYENARDVTIEIKLQKKGYHDQVKRFNVRQALDQQEISTFFELVKQ